MNKYGKIAMQRGLIGMMLGLSIGYTMLLLLTSFQEGFVFTASELPLHYFAAMIVGCWMASSTVVFDVDEWSLLRQTVTHAIIVSPYLVVAFLIGWAPTTVIGGVFFILGYVAIYMIIWLVSKAYWTRKARILNQGITNRNR